MFYIDNISSEDMHIFAEKEDFLSRASIDYEEIKIEGKDGEDLIEKNYLNVMGEITIYLQTNNLDKLYPLFTGKHILRVEDKETSIYFYDMAETFRYGSNNAFSLGYIRSPFWHIYNDSYVIVSDKVVNDGNVYSRPIIKLTGSPNTDVDLTIAGVRFKYHFDMDDCVTIDCNTMEETYEGISKSKNIEIGFDYPKLKVGDNEIFIHSGKVIIEMKRKDSWL